MTHAFPTRLPRLLSLLPRDGLGATVYQSRWFAKGLPTPANARDSESCRWEVKKVQLSFEPSQDGKAARVVADAYGVKYWKGKRVTPEDREMEKIKGAYKYNWQAKTPPPLLVEQARAHHQAKTQAAAAAAAGGTATA